MASGNVGWKSLDVESGSIPEESRPTRLPNGGGGRIVVLAATPDAQSDGWAHRAVVAIARAWAEEGLRIFLMDLGLENPALHEALDLPNEDGVSDAFLYGASVQHIARPALKETIFFAPAGTAAADPEEVLGHPRWDDLTGGFSEADATLLLFLPTDIPGAGGILSRATDIIFLANETESEEEHLGPASVKVMTGLGPSVSSGGEMGLLGSEEVLDPGGLPGDFDLGGVDSIPDPGVEEGAGFGFREGLELAEGFAGLESEDPDQVPREGPAPDDLVPDAFSMREGGGTATEVPDFGAEFAEMPSLDAEVPGSEAVQGLVQGPDFGDSRPMEVDSSTIPAGGEDPPPFPEEEAGKEPVARAETRERPRPTLPPKQIFTRGRVVGLVGAVVVLGAAGLTAFGVLNVPGLTFLQEYFLKIPDPPLSFAGPQATDPLLSFSLELDRFQEDELPFAVQMLDAWRSRLPDLLFTLVPTETESGLSYALLAGPATDRIEAENLRGPAAGVRPQEDPASWLVRETPRAFHLGRWGTLSEAQENLALIEVEGVFGYVLRVSFPDGSEGYDVFAGAYEGIEEARPLQMILRQNGLRNVPLIERRGRRPQ